MLNTVSTLFADSVAPAASSTGTATPGFLEDMLAALAHSPRSISPKYFYDAAGSALFDRICALPEYYPTRTELAILRRHAPAMAAPDRAARRDHRIRRRLA